jgi:thiol-disulfide isomerase/thioredoxin
MRLLRLGLGVLLLVSIVGVGVYVVVKQRSTHDDVVTLELESVAFPTQDGTAVELDDINARIRIINFWASWSPSSVDELKAFALLQEAYGDDIKVIAINRDTTKEEGFAFLEDKGLSDTLLYLYDSEDAYYKELGGYNMPETVFINKKDEVLGHVRGPMTYEDMNSTLRALLAE